MNNRTGVEILGPDNLKNDSGSKVKLTGQWQAAKSPCAGHEHDGMRRFQVTDVEVVAGTCHPPSATTPVSKEKRGKTTAYDAPGADTGSSAILFRGVEPFRRRELLESENKGNLPVKACDI